MPDRGQADTVGAVLLLGVVVVTAGVAGTTTLDAVTSTAASPGVEVTGTVTTESVDLINRGGASIPGADLRLVVRVNGSDTDVAWGNGTLSGGDDAFDPGDRWSLSRSHDPAATVDVTLYHRPSNAALLETTVNPRRPGVAAGDGGAVDARDSEGDPAPPSGPSEGEDEAENEGGDSGDTPGQSDDDESPGNSGDTSNRSGRRR